MIYTQMNGLTKNEESILLTIEHIGNTDGQHHKQWALDQIVRKIFRNEQLYNEWVNSLDYEWDSGIAP